MIGNPRFGLPRTCLSLNFIESLPDVPKLMLFFFLDALAIGEEYSSTFDISFTLFFSMFVDNLRGFSSIDLRDCSVSSDLTFFLILCC